LGKFPPTSPLRNQEIWAIPRGDSNGTAREGALVHGGHICCSASLLRRPLQPQPGDLDTTFDFDGKVTTDFGGPFDRGSSVAIQPDGRIVVAGVSGDDVSGNDFVLARYKRDRTLDADFDIDGKVTTDFGSRFEEASSVAIQPDGKIVAAGFSGDFLVGDFALARYNRDGSLDTSFDADGTVTTDFGSFDQALGVAIQPDGRIVAAGFSQPDFALARYLGR
jgi:uncharacterized delta-60 repeat protein